MEKNDAILPLLEEFILVQQRIIASIQEIGLLNEELEAVDAVQTAIKADLSVAQQSQIDDLARKDELRRLTGQNQAVRQQERSLQPVRVVQANGANVTINNEEGSGGAIRRAYYGGICRIPREPTLQVTAEMQEFPEYAVLGMADEEVLALLAQNELNQGKDKGSPPKKEGGSSK